MTRISILVVNYNGGEVLGETLSSLMELRSEWHELILADNGSTDGSLHRAMVGFAEIQALKLGANLGFGTANNRAAALATGDYLMLVNSDARPAPGCLSRLKSVLDRHPEVGLVSPYLRYPDGRRQFHWAPTTSVFGEAVQMVRNRFESQPWVHRRFGRDRGWYTAACVLIRKTAFDAIGGFDEGFFLYFEDVDLCLRLRAAGWQLVDDPQASAVHIKGGSQAMAPSSAGGLHYRLGQARYYRKHRPLWEQQFVRRKILRKMDDPEARILLERVYESDL